MWVHVIPHFERFLSELELKTEHQSDADGKAERIARSLWSRYWSEEGDFNPRCYVKVGSYGKQTAVRPPSDLDMLFLLPLQDYLRIDRIQGNKQSYLLREVKEALETTFPFTDLSADGQIVEAPFDSYKVEIAPAFNWDGKCYITPHTENGGSWRFSNPAAEFARLQYVDSISGGKKATHLTKMLKAWKRECSVELKSLSLEVLACDFVQTWTFREKTIYYYDWMIRDFFGFLRRYLHGTTNVVGTSEVTQLGNQWITKCETAYGRAAKACEYEHADNEYAAALEWQKIFGQQFRCRSRLALAMAAQ